MKKVQVNWIEGDTFKDYRGQLSYINKFDFKGIKRFYQISNQDVSIIRAWQGHRIEAKSFHVVKGMF